jgi:RP/EB family microtubule-associated protein
LGSGAVYCQIIDIVHPGKIALSKVNWKAKNDYEFINNLKVLQTAFDKIGIKKHVEVEKLAKAKYQDNLEFIQWLKRYYSLNCGERGNNYQAEDKRSGTAVDFTFADKAALSKTSSAVNIETNHEFKKINPTASKANIVQPK